MLIAITQIPPFSCKTADLLLITLIVRLAVRLPSSMQGLMAHTQLLKSDDVIISKILFFMVGVSSLCRGGNG